MTSTGFPKAYLRHYSKYDIKIWFIFSMSSITSKLNAVTTSQSKSKQTWFLWCLMSIGTIQQSDKLNTQSTILTNSSVLVASAISGEWRWQPHQNVLNWVLIPFPLLASLTALVVVVRVAVADVQCSWSQASTLSYYSWPPSRQLLHNWGIKTI